MIPNGERRKTKTQRPKDKSKRCRGKSKNRQCNYLAVNKLSALLSGAA